MLNGNPLWINGNHLLQIIIKWWWYCDYAVL